MTIKKYSNCSNHFYRCLSLCFPLSVCQSVSVSLTIYIYIYKVFEKLISLEMNISTYPTARAVYDTRLIFRRILSLNSEFSFSWASCLLTLKGQVGPNIYPSLWKNTRIHTFSQGVSARWNANILKQDLIACHRVCFLQKWPLPNESRVFQKSCAACFRIWHRKMCHALHEKWQTTYDWRNGTIKPRQN